jgi:hypothetical protein
MDRSGIANLIAETWTTDALGVPTKKETARQVFVAVDSVSHEEWFNGARMGLNPEIRFRMFQHDYAGENVIEYEGNRYAIYRTFIGRNDEIELYAQRKQGDVKNAGDNQS